MPTHLHAHLLRLDIILPYHLISYSDGERLKTAQTFHPIFKLCGTGGFECPKTKTLTKVIIVTIICILVDCSVVPQAKLSCENDTLTVTWSTDVVYDAAVTQIPGDIKQRLRERFINANGYQVLTMIIISRKPL